MLIAMSTIDWLVLIWLTVLGGCIGSFLNVVIYRLPRGDGLQGRSHCPKCKHQIRAYHNIPVFGWLMLCGACHDCGKRISSRYPLVEAATGMIFAALFFAVFKVGQKTGDPLAQASPWALYFCTAILCSGLICEVLIRSDRQKVPRAVRGVLTLSGLAWGLMAILM